MENNKKIGKITIVVLILFIIAVVFYYYVLPQINDDYKEVCSKYGLNYFVVSGKEVDGGKEKASYCCNTNNNIHNDNTCYEID